MRQKPTQIRATLVGDPLGAATGFTQAVLLSLIFWLVVLNVALI